METISNCNFYDAMLARTARVNCSGSIIRYLEQNLVIKTFTPGVLSGYYNREYIINKNPNHRIWLSQLRHLFLYENDDGELKFLPSFIIKKDQQLVSLRNMIYEEFEQIVNGKKFIVSAQHLLAVNDKGVWETTIGKICDAYQNKNSEEFMSLVVNKIHYILTEI